MCKKLRKVLRLKYPGSPCSICLRLHHPSSWASARRARDFAADAPATTTQIMYLSSCATFARFQLNNRCELRHPRKTIQYNNTELHDWMIAGLNGQNVGTICEFHQRCINAAAPPPSGSPKPTEQ